MRFKVLVAIRNFQCKTLWSVDRQKFWPRTDDAVYRKNWVAIYGKPSNILVDFDRQLINQSPAIPPAHVKIFNKMLQNLQNFCNFLALAYCCSQSGWRDARIYIFITYTGQSQRPCGVIFHDVTITITVYFNFLLFCKRRARFRLSIQMPRPPFIILF